MTKAIIIIAIIFFVFVIGKNLFDGRKTSSSKKTNGGNKSGEAENESRDGAVNFRNFFGGNNSNSELPRRTDDTFTFSPWTVYVLDKEGNVIEEKSMNVTDKKSFSIGYGDECDLTVKSDYVSRVHLRIGKDEQGYFARDNNSLNGTFVDEKEIRGESFSLEEMLVYVADVPIYFKKRSMSRPAIVPNFVGDEAGKVKNFGEFSKTRSWKPNKSKDSGEAPLKR